MVATAPKYEFGVVISGTKPPPADWVRVDIWRGLAPIALDQKDLCALPVSFLWILCYDERRRFAKDWHVCLACDLMRFKV